MTRKYYKSHITLLEQQIKDISTLLEHDRQHSNAEEISTRQELEVKRNMVMREIERCRDLMRSTAQKQKQTTYLVECGAMAMRIRIVEPHEADPRSGRVSSQSPLGKALYGKQAGDSVTVETPIGTQTYMVLEVAAIA
ncbi:MAG: Transcription elongation factor GreA [candidate division WS6 bacterium OLB20]|uniref:Transcription elongation factor GreA n=1 Tax=candidate division WS6 bacterium OLB20 TaxID=1617426 RepID=A0A136M0K5_9BACT|nr:MAG: Transcription elongation factor GreA [candidate division WS6 bacterium OLB20]